MKNILHRALLALLPIPLLPALAAEPGIEATLKPLTRHVLAPRTSIDLCGLWDFAKVPKEEYKVPDPKDATKEITKYRSAEVADFNDLAWTRITLPKMQSCWFREDQYYRTYVGLPSNVATKRVVLKFEKAVDTLYIIVNGKKYDPVATYELPWEFDISADVKPGPNEIIVNVYNGLGDRAWADWPQIHGWALADFWGLSRPIHLEIMDKVYIDYPVIRTTTATNKVLTLTTVVRNDTSQDVTAGFRAEIKKDAWSKLFQAKAPNAIIPAHGSYEFAITQRWDSAELWNPEHPKLYDLDLIVSVDDKPRDAYRQRFGFRELSIVGNQFLVNGKPYIHRRNGFGGGPDIENIKAEILRVRELGITGKRQFGGDWVREIEAADEAGAFVTPVAPCGNGAAWKNDVFWERLGFYQEKMIRTFINHPSVLVWALGNEFGTIYAGEGSPEEKPATAKQVELGRKAEALDPTRAWTYCGEVDIGYPVKGTIGPAPIRSFHYPIASCQDGITFPESGYWYAKGELSWQRISTHDKPLMISEDIFHGTTDQHIGMAKAGGDAIWTTLGYAKTLHYIIRCFAEGHYFAGLGGWHTWVTDHDNPNNLLNSFGQLIPNFLIATRENFPNLRGGESVVRNLYCYNQLFTPYECTLSREDLLGSKSIFSEVRSFTLEQGAKHHEKIFLTAPKVDKPTPFQVKFTLRTGERILTSRTYNYTIFPPKRDVQTPRGSALFASHHSTLRAIANLPVYEDLDALLATRPRAILVDRILSNDEGRRLNDYVLAGGRVLLVEADELSWSPLKTEFHRPYSFSWRRNDDRMQGLHESWLHAWLPDHTLGHASYPKSADDTLTLWDVGLRDGLQNASTLWLHRGRGAWLLCQLPVLSRFTIEPAAPHVLQALLDEFGSHLPTLEGRVIAAPGETRDLLHLMSIETHDSPATKHDILVLNASTNLEESVLTELTAHTRRGGTVLLLEATPDTNTNLYAQLGLSLSPYPETKRNGQISDRTPKWHVVDHRSGLQAGLCSEDTFWGDPGRMYSFMMDRMCGKDPDWTTRKPVDAFTTGTLALLPGSKATLHLQPACFADAPLHRGRILLSTLRFSAHAPSHLRLASRHLRTLLNNLGAKTSTPEPIRDLAFLDIRSSLNRNLWNDPLYQLKDGSFEPKGWFGTDNDLRYFPVNQCGWSMVARNFCPKEAFPTQPLNLGGIPFSLTDPASNNGKACLVIEPGQTIRVPLPPNTSAERLWFLGAMEGADGKTSLEMRLPSTHEPIVFYAYQHFGIYRWSCSISKGSIAWCGQTIKDSQASLYCWPAPLPPSSEPIPYLEFTNPSTKPGTAVAIIAITAELP